MSAHSSFGFRTDARVTDWLARPGHFTLSAEIIPPRNGGEATKILAQVERLIASGAEFLSVTKGAGGSLRGGSLPIAQSIKERFGVPCIAHFTCRDLTPEEVENLLMDHHYFGIRNILALRGDPPDGQAEWKPREGGYHYAYQLIEQIRAMNEGRFLTRANSPEGLAASPSQERTRFCIGAAAYPEHPNVEEGLDYFTLKARAGAEFGITDMLYDVDAYSRFLEGLGRRGIQIPILPGTRVLKSQAQAERMMKKFRVSIPKALFSKLPPTESPESERIGTELFLELTESLRRAGAPGIHVFVIIDTTLASSAIRSLIPSGGIPNYL